MNELESGEKAGVRLMDDKLVKYVYPYQMLRMILYDDMIWYDVMW